MRDFFVRKFAKELMLGFLDKGFKPHTVKFGFLKGCRFILDAQSQLQVILGFWEAELGKYFRKIFQSCEWFIDVGAGRGEHAIAMLRSRKMRKVIAFEPIPSEREFFKSNLELNGFSNDDRIEISEAFVSDTAGGGQKRLSDLQVNKNLPGAIKIDVDGAEIQVLRGALDLFSTHQNTLMLIIETHSSQLERECSEMLANQGFKVEIIKNAFWRKVLPEYRPIEHNRWLFAERHRKTYTKEPLKSRFFPDEQKNW